MQTIKQSIGQIHPLLVGENQENIMKFIFNQDNNNWRKRNGYPMKRKGLNKRKEKRRKCFMLDETFYLDNGRNKKYLEEVMKRGRKYNLCLDEGHLMLD